MKKELKILECYLNIVNINSFPTTLLKMICTNVEELINHISKKIELNCEIKIKFSHRKHNNTNVSCICCIKKKVIQLF